MRSFSKCSFLLAAILFSAAVSGAVSAEGIHLGPKLVDQI